MNKDQLRNWAVNNGAVSYTAFPNEDYVFFKPAALPGTAYMAVINIGTDAYAFLESQWKWSSQVINGLCPVSEF